jgi:hypothetical protein
MRLGRLLLVLGWLPPLVLIASINSIMTDDCGRVGLVRSGLLASLQPIRTLRVTGSAVVWAANLEQIRIANSREITLLAEACAFYWHRMEGVLTS